MGEDTYSKERAAAAYMSGVLQAAYEKGNVNKYSIAVANDMLEDADMAHCKIVRDE